MKKLGFLLIVLSFTIIFGACPPLEEDELEGITVTFDEPFELGVYKWFEILDNIAKERKYVKLDLSKGTYLEGNEAGGLTKVTIDDGTFSQEYLAFDPFPASSSGKNYILSIILPTEAQMIKPAIIDDTKILGDEENIEDTKKCSAFRSFTNLRSVTADNVTFIGNFAFADCTSLSEINFPRVGHSVSDEELEDKDNTMEHGYRTDIGKYAFLGCTALEEIKFNSAAVIGGYAFKDCTKLTKIDFPEVWIIEKNAFEGCVSLVNVFFEKTSKIGDEAFKDCTGLKKAEFNVKPIRLFSEDPLDDDPCVYDSVIFYPSVFSGCKALEVLNVRRAWNVYFSENALAYTGSEIEIYLFDEPSAGTVGFGHPQNALFLGDVALATTLKKVTILVPSDGEKIIMEISASENIAKHILEKYPKIDVNINRRSM